MPFTLAHPAAILPLKRFCPRWLSFSALVVGSIAPDAGYAFGSEKISDLSHTFAGSFLFSLPMGIIMLGALYALRGPVVARLPERQREVFQPLCRLPVPAPHMAVFSLLLGAWTHLAWDAVTHNHSWLVRQMPVLQTRIAVIHDHQMELCHVLWYVSSFAGVAVLCFAYEIWLMSLRGPVSQKIRAVALRHAVLVGLLVLPIETVHHLVDNIVGFALAGVCTIVLVLVVALNIGSVIPGEE